MCELYTVTELAKELGVTARAVRLYEDKGLITPRRVGTTRVYSRRDRARLILILRGKRLGFSLKEIGHWLALYATDNMQRDQMCKLRDLVDQRLAALRQQQQDLCETIQELESIEQQVAAHLKALDPGHGGSGPIPDQARPRSLSGAV
jgi:DNA-binding transcriptional MerR regulator|tara:strand:+ start:9836 stop:10279 length:444 start_codon:yes stop_codon:yes gene_type:complete